MPDKKLSRKPCHALWLTPIIRSDGEVSVCLSDIDGHMKLGNLNDNSFLQIWLGESANKFRIWHAEGNATNISVCSHCTYYEANTVEGKVWNQFEEIMQKELNFQKSLKPKIDEFNQIPNKLLTFDLTNVCNLSCFYCTFTQEDKHSKKLKRYMKVDEVKKVCNEMLLHGSFFETICLSVSGEPTLNPGFKDIIKYLFEINGPENRLFRNISLNTNVTFLDPHKTDLIFDYVSKGFGNLHFTLSINSASKESFLKSKKVDEFERTIENTKYFLKKKAEFTEEYQWRVNTYLLCLVNEMVNHELHVFRDFWSDYLEQLGMNYEVAYALPTEQHNVIIFKRTYANEELFTLSQAEYDEMHRKAAEDLGLKPKIHEPLKDLRKHIPTFSKKPDRICGSPWLSPVIRHDGTLNFCLTDVDNLMPIGNVFESSFFELWYQANAESLRRRHARQEFGKWDMCNDCSYFDGVEIPKELRSSYKTI